MRLARAEKQSQLTTQDTLTPTPPRQLPPDQLNRAAKTSTEYRPSPAANFSLRTADLTAEN